MTVLEMKSLISHIQYKDWTFHLDHYDRDIYLQCRFKAKCSVSDIVEDQRGRKWRLSLHMTKSEIIATAFKAVMTAEEHEVRDHFKYYNQPIYTSHYDVDGLLHLCERQSMDVRPAT